MLKCDGGLSPRQLWRIAVDPAYVMESAGQPPDDWQADMLRKAPTPGFRGLLLSSRQAGKSTSLSSLAVWWALTNPRYDVLVIAPTLRQAVELVHKCRFVVDQLGLKLAADAATKLVLAATGGRIIALAATGHIRGMTAGMCIVDEGARLGLGSYFRHAGKHSSYARRSTRRRKPDLRDHSRWPARMVLRLVHVGRG